MSLKQSFILMTAMPPTKGHRDLIQFANQLVDVSRVQVIVCTQDGEPFINERCETLANAFIDDFRVDVDRYHATAPQFPTGSVQEINDFWNYWHKVLRRYGYHDGDYIVSSESYGLELAKRVNGRFMPYDMNRDIFPCNATAIRQNPRHLFDEILPEFQPHLIKTVTFFGAESCGKTTLSRAAAEFFDSHYLPEWARPYLECVGSEVTDDRMDAIFKGQYAMQCAGQRLRDKPFIVQDTDLYSTLGYWELHHNDGVPGLLYGAAKRTSSDLYLVCSSEIPFEPDPLRYGGDVRETTDQYWIDICEKYALNYCVITGPNQMDRELQCVGHMSMEFGRTANRLFYEREKAEK